MIVSLMCFYAIEGDIALLQTRVGTIYGIMATNASRQENIRKWCAMTFTLYWLILNTKLLIKKRPVT